jgi:ERF superfamily
MHRSSETIGAMAAALAKAQAELANPEKTLTATVAAPNGERSFRYASLANGLDLIRKCLGQHEIAMMQTTAIDQGQITLTTLLVHASGEWVSSLWPVCAAAEASAQLKGAALTYARRYALFTLVGIAGEDDLDAPDLLGPPRPAKQAARPTTAGHNGGARSLPPLPAGQSAELRDRLLDEISRIDDDEALALWAYRSLPIKNTLLANDAQAVEAACEARAAAAPVRPVERAAPADGDGGAGASHGLVSAKPIRRRSKAHLAFVASQPCLVCKATPCDPHHLKIARPRSLGRKVSDEFTVPLCRKHHQELHRHGNEANWWANMQIAPLPLAKELWEISLLQLNKAAAPLHQKSSFRL